MNHKNTVNYNLNIITVQVAKRSVTIKNSPTKDYTRLGRSQQLTHEIKKSNGPTIKT